MYVYSLDTVLFYLLTNKNELLHLDIWVRIVLQLVLDVLAKMTTHTSSSTEMSFEQKQKKNEREKPTITNVDDRSVSIATAITWHYIFGVFLFSYF